MLRCFDLPYLLPHAKFQVSDRTMKSKTLTSFILSLGIAVATYAQGYNERDIQACVCEGMAQEVSTKAGTRVDCVDDTHAVEVEALQDWAKLSASHCTMLRRQESRPKSYFSANRMRVHVSDIG